MCHKAKLIIKNSTQPEIDKALDALGTGEVSIVAEWDRATPSMMDGIKIIFAFLSAVAEDERERINQQAKEGDELLVRSARSPTRN